MKPCRFAYRLRHVSRSSWEVGVWGLGRGTLRLFVLRKLRVVVVGVGAVDRAQNDRIMQME